MYFWEESQELGLLLLDAGQPLLLSQLAGRTFAQNLTLLLYRLLLYQATACKLRMYLHTCLQKNSNTSSVVEK